MVDQNEDFGPSTPPPGSDLGDLNRGEGSPGNASGGPVPLVAETPEAAFKHPQHAPEKIDERPHHPFFPIVLGGAMLLTLVVAWAVNSRSKPVEPAGTAAADTGPGPAPAPETPGNVAAPDDGVKSLRSDLDGIKADLKSLQDRLDAMPKPAPAPDLEPLNSKIDDLAKNNKELAALPKKVDALNERVGEVDKSLADQREAIDTLKGEVKKPGNQAPVASRPETTTNRPEDVNVSDSAMDDAIDLFKAGKYKEASDAFKKLTETNPNDARVWYYAALSRGSATNQWTGETTRLVEKGVEREKAGSPESSKVDAVFAGLNPAFKPWLEAFRKAIKPR